MVERKNVDISAHGKSFHGNLNLDSQLKNGIRSVEHGFPFDGRSRPWTAEA